MFCPKCGAQLEEGAKFCSSCGESIAETDNHEEPAFETAPEQETSYTYTIPENPNQTVFTPTSVSGTENQSGGGAAIASLVLGIVSFVCCCCGVIAIPGIVCGILGLNSNKRGLAIAGLIISSIVFLLWIFSLITSLVSGDYMEMLDEIQNAISEL